MGPRMLSGIRKGFELYPIRSLDFVDRPMINEEKFAEDEWRKIQFCLERDTVQHSLKET